MRRTGHAIAVVIGMTGGCQAIAQAYFQQRVDTRIQVTLDDVRHRLDAYEEFDYVNNSDRALDTIWVHLWPNAYSDRGTALCHQLDGMDKFDLHFASEADRGSIDSLDFRSGGQPQSWGYDPAHRDIAWIKLSAAVPKGGTVTIGTPFRVKVPEGRFSRLGHDGRSYAITQWFPKPAVYDRDGWHAMPFLDQGEFYSEFGSYDVRITLPANYVVGATGELQDGAAEEVWMDSLARAPLRQAAGKHSTGGSFPPSSPRMKTLHFRQDDVHDFAWFADKRYQVRNSQVQLPNGHVVRTRVLFTERNAGLWKDAADYVDEAVAHYARWVGEYPYAMCTAVEGTISAGGGMEYPMITVIGDVSDAEELDDVITHEVGHNWFYGMLASNERDHPWMDEGMNSFEELRYMRERHPKGGLQIGLPLLGRVTSTLQDKHRVLNELTYRLNARRGLDQPIDLPSTCFTALNYGAMVYSKTALVFDQLFAYLGPDRFDQCMRAYFDAWHHEHPGPEDVRNAFEQACGLDLAWAFDELLGTAHKVDIQAKALEGNMLTYRSTASTRMPFPVTGMRDADTLGVDTLGTVWVQADPGRGTVTLPWKDADQVRIDAFDRTLDIDRRNDRVRDHGLFKHSVPHRLKFLVGLERDDRRTTYWTPALAYNAHDGWMGGLALYNTTFPSQKLEYVIAPLFGSISERVVGAGRVMYHFDRLRSRTCENIHLGASVNSASLRDLGPVSRWFLRVSPSVALDLRNGSGQTRLRHTVTYRTVVLQQHSQGTVDATNVDALNEDIYHVLTYSVREPHGLMPFEASLTALQHPAFTRLELDATQRFIYDTRKHRVTLRLFAGTFLRRDDALMHREMGWRLYWGSSDLLFDHAYLERQDVGRITAAQMTKYQGGFKTPNALGTSDSWITAVNVEADLPIPALSLFGSWGAAPYVEVTQNGRRTSWRSYYEAGFGIRLVRDVMEMWVPLVYSKEIGDQLELQGFTFLERIRFVFALEKLDPTRILRRITD
ncbi:MAG: M1 family metallopeptidase [Flavobacteriales bacterium]|nr:M1 family metallopeptidase [Flavobacteriales bacterium]